jgi:hypothetical protein
MKTVVLTCLSCVLLAGVYFILNKKSQEPGLLSLRQPVTVVSAVNNIEDTSKVNSLNRKDSVSNTLNDSHWLDDDTFQKAVEADLMMEGQPKAAENPQPKTPEKRWATPKHQKEAPQAQPMKVRSLILELEPDTTTRKSVPVEVV